MAPRPRLAAARQLASISASKATLEVLRRSGQGGTAAPGLVALQIDPEVVSKIARRLPSGAVVVAGTNGKTTTSRMIADIIEASGLKVIHNRSGSNLARGVAATFVQHSSLSGKPDGRYRIGRSRAARDPSARETAPTGVEQSLPRPARPLWRARCGWTEMESRVRSPPRDQPVDRQCRRSNSREHHWRSDCSAHDFWAFRTRAQANPASPCGRCRG